MTRWVVQLEVRDGREATAVDAALAALARLEDGSPEVQVSRGGRHLPGSVGGAAATWDLTCAADPLAVLAEQPEAREVLAIQDAVALAPLVEGTVPTPAPLIKRTLLLRVRPDTAADTVRRFEVDLAAMADHISSIRSFALSRVDQQRRPSRWTHVWEQEYQTLDGLTGEYMRHPYHWAGVDRWFDHEMPDRIVEPELAHVFYESPVPVLGLAEAPGSRG